MEIILIKSNRGIRIAELHQTQHINLFAMHASFGDYMETNVVELCLKGVEAYSGRFSVSYIYFWNKNESGNNFN